MVMLPPMIDDPMRRSRFENQPPGRGEPPHPIAPSSAETQGRLIVDSILWAAFLIFLLGFAITLADILFR